MICPFMFHRCGLWWYKSCEDQVCRWLETNPWRCANQGIVWAVGNLLRFACRHEWSYLCILSGDHSFVSLARLVEPAWPRGGDIQDLTPKIQHRLFESFLWSCLCCVMTWPLGSDIQDLTPKFQHRILEIFLWNGLYCLMTWPLGSDIQDSNSTSFVGNCPLEGVYCLTTCPRGSDIQDLTPKIQHRLLEIWSFGMVCPKKQPKVVPRCQLQLFLRLGGLLRSFKKSSKAKPPSGQPKSTPKCDQKLYFDANYNFFLGWAGFWIPYARWEVEGGGRGRWGRGGGRRRAWPPERHPRFDPKQSASLVGHESSQIMGYAHEIMYKWETAHWFHELVLAKELKNRCLVCSARHYWIAQLAITGCRLTGHVGITTVRRPAGIELWQVSATHLVRIFSNNLGSQRFSEVTNHSP